MLGAEAGSGSMQGTAGAPACGEAAHAEGGPTLRAMSPQHSGSILPASVVMDPLPDGTDDMDAVDGPLGLAAPLDPAAGGTDPAAGDTEDLNDYDYPATQVLDEPAAGSGSTRGMGWAGAVSDAAQAVPAEAVVESAAGGAGLVVTPTRAAGALPWLSCRDLSMLRQR